MRIVPVSQLPERDVSWLWDYRLPSGKPALFDGDPGLGKSLVALDLCARLSTARPFPDGSPSPGPANSLVLSAEDGLADTVRKRLKALGADMDRVFVLEPDDTEGLLRLPSRLDFLKGALAQTDARLLVFDPFTSFLDPGVNVASETSVRRVVEPLARVTEAHQCHPLLLRHLNKSGGRNPLYRGLHSIGLGAACRSTFLFAPDPGEPSHMVMAHVKNNLGPLQPSLVYTLPTDPAAPLTVTWVGTTPLRARQLLAGPAREPAGPPRDHARTFLAALLKAGPRTSREVWQEARAEGLSERTLRRAKGDLEVRSQRVSREGTPVTYWLLPGQKLPDADPPDLEKWLGPLREQFPPATPLDDL
jgi:AAA domain